MQATAEDIDPRVVNCHNCGDSVDKKEDHHGYCGECSFTWCEKCDDNLHWPEFCQFCGATIPPEI